MFRMILMICLVAFSSVRAEIEELVLKWNAVICLNECIPMLEQQLRNIKNITNLHMNARAGVAVMEWKPNYPFSYEPFNLATRVIGVRIEDFRVRVRGTINYSEGNFYAVSLGDNTSFLLLGPSYGGAPGRYATKNIAAHQLSDQTKARLLSLFQSQKVVEIEGPLYQPLTYLLMLIVEQLKVEKEGEMNPVYNI